MKIDHYVFDDCSDIQTKETLLRLKQKYDFNLFLNKERVGIFKRLYLSLFNIPLDYDYYVKFDSDVEILSDNFFPEILDVFNYPEKVSGTMPRIEGVRNVDRYDTTIQFYAGHAIKYDAAATSGCCMVFTNKIFNSFPRKTLEELKILEDKWGVDSVLYDHAQKVGKFIAVEDLSVYHIDNAYGQRRVNNSYFTDRKRWNIIDNDEVWFMKVSELIAPQYLDRVTFDKVKRSSTNFEEFIINCKQYLEDKDGFEIIMDDEDKQMKKEDKKPVYLKKMYKVTSPLNFGKDPHMTHGTFKYFSQIPKWAINNVKVVIETEDVPVDKDTEEVKTKGKRKQKDITLHISEKNGKIKRNCAKCEYETYSEKWLERHIQKKHS